MALNFPSSPSDGDTFLGSNGINYVFDSTDGTWNVYNDPALAGSQVWYRNPVTAELLPVYVGDSVVTDGDITTAGKFIGDVDIESYPSLP